MHNSLQEIDAAIKTLKNLKKSVLRVQNEVKGNEKIASLQYQKMLLNLRTCKGASLQKMADFLGVTKAAYHKWETGIEPLPFERIEQIKKNIFNFARQGIKPNKLESEKESASVLELIIYNTTTDPGKKMPDQGRMLSFSKHGDITFSKQLTADFDILGGGYVGFYQNPKNLTEWFIGLDVNGYNARPLKGKQNVCVSKRSLTAKILDSVGKSNPDMAIRAKVLDESSFNLELEDYNVEVFKIDFSNGISNKADESQ